MQVNFWFDPTCPWAYVTSRWYTKVANELNIPTEWEIFSLSIKNRSNNYSEEMKAKHFKSLRVIGKQFHVDKMDIDANLNDILKTCGIDESYLNYMDDESIDEQIESSTMKAVEVCGNDVGVPIILLNDGTHKNAIFGPIISEVPSLEESLKLWDEIGWRNWGLGV